MGLVSRLKSLGRKAVSVLAGNKEALWPPESETERLKTYATNELLYDGDHYAVFIESEDYAFTAPRNHQYLVVNLCRRSTDLVVSRLVGEAAVVWAPDEFEVTQAFFDHLMDRNGMDALLADAAGMASVRGDIFLKVFYAAAEQRIVIDTFHAGLATVEVDPLDKRRMLACNIGQVLPGDKEDEQFLWIERHELRESGEGEQRQQESWIVNVLYRLEGGEGGYTYYPSRSLDPSALEATKHLPAERPTGIDALLVVHWPNNRGNDRGFWGTSDYTADLKGVQGELNNRKTWTGEVINNCEHPVYWGPQLGDDRGRVNLVRSKYVPVTANESGPAMGLLEWSQNTRASTEQSEDLTEKFAVVSGHDIGALIPPKAGGPISGEALRKGQMITGSTVKKKQPALCRALQQVFSVASKLVGAPEVSVAWEPPEGVTGNLEPLEPEDITVVLGDGLPTDDKDTAEYHATLVEAKLESRVDAIVAIHEVSREEAQQMVQEIDADGAAASATASPLPGFGGLEGQGLELGLGPAPVEGASEALMAVAAE